MSSTSDFYIKPLDGIRGMAVLMVMFFHYNLMPYDSIVNGLTAVAKFGQTGVTLFFVLSGFLITRILIKAKNNQNYFSHFYIRRSLRIFPLYYFFLFITFFLLPLFTNKDLIPFIDQLPFYLFYQNVVFTFNPASIEQTGGLMHYWSLAVEEHFYLFWPLVIYFCSIKNSFRVIFLIAAIAFVSRFILFSYGYEVFYFTLCRMDAIAIGCYVALMEHQSKYDLKINWKKHISILFVMLIFFGSLWVVYREKSSLFIQVIKDIPYYYVYFLLIISVVSKEENMFQQIIKKIFLNRFLLFAGKISFSLYIYHAFCYGIIALLPITSIYASIFICFALSFLVATLSYYYFEMPFLKLKDRFSDYKITNV